MIRLLNGMKGATICLAFANLLACAPNLPVHAISKDKVVVNYQKTQVVDLLNAIVTGASEPVAIINPDKYIQHNLGAADGLAGFKGLQQIVPKGANLKPVRVFQDGDYVFTHTDYNVFAPMIGFDIFRFENGKVVEHWDNLQAKAGLNPSGRSMIDGPTEAQDLDKTEANKALARGFVEDVLVNGKLDKLASYCNGDNYIQHHPQISDGVASLTEAFKGMAAAGITSKYDRIHLVLGEGNFVLVASEGHFNGKPTAFYDLFRIEDGKVAEHWDVVETIAERSEWKNANGKFLPETGNVAHSRKIVMNNSFDDESEALKSTVLQYMSAFMKGDVSAVMATYAEDGVLMAPIGPAIEGKKQLADVYPGMFAAVDFNLVTKVTEVFQTGADWGFVRTATKGTQTTKSNGRVEPASYLELFVLRKSETGAWKIARYSTTQIGNGE